MAFPTTEAELERIIEDKVAAALTHLAQLADVLEGVGTPEALVAAPRGALYRDRAGGAGTTFYVKETGPLVRPWTNTGWDAK